MTKRQLEAGAFNCIIHFSWMMRVGEFVISEATTMGGGDDMPVNSNGVAFSTADD